jgi:hypothetical protein
MLMSDFVEWYNLFDSVDEEPDNNVEDVYQDDMASMLTSRPIP